jgi:hypothetical protein
MKSSSHFIVLYTLFHIEEFDSFYTTYNTVPHNSSRLYGFKLLTSQKLHLTKGDTSRLGIAFFVPLMTDFAVSFRCLDTRYYRYVSNNEKENE